MNDRLIAMIKKNEGYRSKPYRCTAGKLTIGYGHNLDDNGISAPVAELMLTEDISKAYYDVVDIFQGFYAFSTNRQNALIDMMFNLGRTRFWKFRKMIQAIKIGEWQEAAREAINSLWYEQVGDRAKRNVKLILEG